MNRRGRSYVSSGSGIIQTDKKGRRSAPCSAVVPNVAQCRLRPCQPAGRDCASDSTAPSVEFQSEHSFHPLIWPLVNPPLVVCLRPSEDVCIAGGTLALTKIDIPHGDGGSPQDSLFGPRKYLRTNGAPDKYAEQFSLPASLPGTVRPPRRQR